MSQKVQTSAAVLILFLLSVVAYQSTLRQATDQVREWLRRRGDAVCHPGCRMVTEFTSLTKRLAMVGGVVRVL